MPIPVLNENCADIAEVVQRLWDKQFLERGVDTLTLEGFAYIQSLRLKGGYRQISARARYGAIASGRNVVEDDEIFDEVAEQDREVLGLEREGTGIAAGKREFGLHYVLVVKGVQDFAGQDKKASEVVARDFAAQASAICLIDFLRV